ncbi:Formamidopyrimidine-DNA glycosylase [compost metagenome]
MSDLIAIEARKRDLEKTCLNGTLKRVDVRNAKLLRGIDPQALQQALVNARITQLQRKGKYLLLQTDRGQTLIVSMQEDADLACVPYPATEHSADAGLILTFDDGHTLDLRLPSMNDLFYYFSTTDERLMDPLKTVGPDPREMTFTEFRKALGERTEPSFPIWQALLSQHLISGLDPALADEICFQGRVRPDRPVSKLLKAEWERLYDKMQKILKTVSEVSGNMEELDKRGYLMPRRGNDRGCPSGEGIAVLHFPGSQTSYYCPSCQEDAPWEGKKANFW